MEGPCSCGQSGGAPAQKPRSGARSSSSHARGHAPSAVAVATASASVCGLATPPAVMEDVRVQWLGLRVRHALGVKDEAPFEELLNRGDGEQAERILRFLNQGAATPEEGAPSALFLSQELRLEEIEVEIGAGGLRVCACVRDGAVRRKKGGSEHAQCRFLHIYRLS